MVDEPVGFRQFNGEEVRVHSRHEDRIRVFAQHTAADLLLNGNLHSRDATLSDTLSACLGITGARVRQAPATLFPDTDLLVAGFQRLESHFTQRRPDENGRRRANRPSTSRPAFRFRRGPARGHQNRIAQRPSACVDRRPQGREPRSLLLLALGPHAFPNPVHLNTVENEQKLAEGFTRKRSRVSLPKIPAIFGFFGSHRRANKCKIIG